MFKPNSTVAWVIKCENKFLLVEETENNRQVLNQPAGHLEANESLLQAAKRELKEETGLAIEPQFIVGIYQNEIPDKSIQYLRFCYGAEIKGPCPATAPEDNDITAAHWLTIDEINTRLTEHRSPMVKVCFDDYLAGQRYDLSLIKSFIC